MTTTWGDSKSEIYVVGVRRASDLLMSTNTRGDVDACISIADPYQGKRPPADGFLRVPHRLVLTFDDVLVHAPNEGAFAPQREDAEQIIRFGRTARVRPGKRMLVHCFAGISRSTAAALLILADRHGAGQEDAAVRALVEACEDREPFPNETLVQLGDELLSRGGALSAAVRRFTGNGFRVGTASEDAKP